MHTITLDQVHRLYRERVQEWADRNRYPLSLHIRNIAALILLHRDEVGGLVPTGFIKAFLENDLRGCLNKADSEVRDHLLLLHKAWYNIDTYDLKMKAESGTFSVLYPMYWQEGNEGLA